MEQKYGTGASEKEGLYEKKNKTLYTYCYDMYSVYILCKKNSS